MRVNSKKDIYKWTENADKALYEAKLKGRNEVVDGKSYKLSLE